MVEIVAGGVVGDEQVDQSVAVIIDRCDGQCLAGLDGTLRAAHDDARGTRYIAEYTIAVIAVQPVGGAVEVVGGADRAPQPGDPEIDFQVGVARPLDVVTDEQVEVAVVFDIDEGAGSAPVIACPAGAAGNGNVDKAPALIAQQAVLAERRDIHIRPAVVVVITGGGTHAVTAEGQSGLRGDIREPAVAVVAVQGRRGRLALLVAGEPVRVDQQQVLVAVVVVIEEGETAANALRHEFFSVGTAGVHETDAGRCRDSGESDVRRLCIGGIRLRDRAAHGYGFPAAGCALVGTQQPHARRDHGSDHGDDAERAIKGTAYYGIGTGCCRVWSVLGVHGRRGLLFQGMDSVAFTSGRRS